MRAPIFAAGIAILAGLARAGEHWAYVPPVEARVPAGAVDGFLAEAWEKAGLEPAELAPPREWIERAAYTLTGLPASLEQIRRIEKSPDEATWKALVDELLASPAYGERWARHWMDVARYADTRGYNFDQDNRYPFAYTYRDWLIRAFNEDLPFADFIKLQIAADHLTGRPDHPDLAALGFLTTGPRAGGLETIDDRVDVVSRGFLASTVACARCHDHKSDPITTRDYFSLYSVFENTTEPEMKPVIGKAPDEAAFQAYTAEMAKLEAADRAARQAIVDQLRGAESLAVYLDLAWLAKRESWDANRATGEAFKRGRYRPNAVIRWRDFMNGSAWGGEAHERLARWAAEMDTAGEGERLAISRALADEWLAAPEGSELRNLAERPACPLSLDVARVDGIFDTEDGNKHRERAGAMNRLQAEHAGSPPRAMSLADRENWSPAQIFIRGNPDNRGEKFEREWLGFLGGGKFPEGKSPRLALAEKIADPANPLTARVIVNRVWAWHFGEALADPGDFGVETAEPPLRELLDWLAVDFTRNGGSLKDLHRKLLATRTFRLAADGPRENRGIDEANTRFWKWNRRRADFEAMRDRLLTTAGTLDTATTGGRSISLDEPRADRRRSVYAFIDRYALANTFVAFDLPHPDHHSARRVETTVPQQALYLLNGPLVLRQAAKLAADPAFQALPDDRAKVAWLYRRIYQREPAADEQTAALAWLAAADPADYEPRLAGVWEIRHAPDDGRLDALQPFPLFADGVWKTGPDLATAPIRWLHAGPTGGHASAGHALVLRWRALGAGEVRMVGEIRRTQQGGVPLVWQLNRGAEMTLPPESSAVVAGEWTRVAAGDTLDFVLRAPHGDSCGGVGWAIRVLGRESPDGEDEEIADLREDFPKADSPPPSPAPADPWADLIQMLWAANEFHFID